MITTFKDGDVRKSGVIYDSTLNLIKKLYGQNPAQAGELAISAIELTLTGQISSDDFAIECMLETLKAFVSNDKEKYEKRVEAQRLATRENQQLDEIAELYTQGFTQKIIGDKLGISQQQVSYRLKKIREEYPELINTKNTKKTKHDNVNENDNDNDNLNDNEDTTSRLDAYASSPSAVANAPLDWGNPQTPQTRANLSKEEFGKLF